MDITPQCVVALTWTLKDTLGEVLDELDSPVEFLVGGTDLLPRIEQALQGHAKGARLQLSLEPQDAFGDFDERFIFLQPRALFPQGLEEGMLVEASALPPGAAAMPADRIYTVTDIYPDHVVLDGNHPLAGIGLRLDLRVHDVREATADEVGHGSAGVSFFRAQPAPRPDHGHAHSHSPNGCGCSHQH